MEITFNRKPSKSQIIKALQKAVNQGNQQIEIIWGENWLDFQKQSNGNWCGFGWIKEIGADTLANELNAWEHRQLLNLYNS